MPKGGIVGKKISLMAKEMIDSKVKAWKLQCIDDGVFIVRKVKG